METVALVIIAAGLIAFFALIIGILLMTWRAIAKLVALIGVYRAGKRFFKQIERFRRDFNK